MIDVYIMSFYLLLEMLYCILLCTLLSQLFSLTAIYPMRTSLYLILFGYMYSTNKKAVLRSNACKHVFCFDNSISA